MRFTLHYSRFTFHVSLLTFHSSRFTFRASGNLGAGGRQWHSFAST